MEKIAKITAVREFFGTPDRPVEMAEIKTFWASLKSGEHQWFAQECAKALGKELEDAPAK